MHDVAELLATDAVESGSFIESCAESEPGPAETSDAIQQVAQALIGPRRPCNMFMCACRVI